ncbi:hypothetical protein GQ55_6G177900 [Panicum hallii var. hallii]|uniref:DUF4408 domain-containing protein n=1 Tax=Panicum hallii var. hallii TaxID=1504633 RepID=A0A2T7D702_9POAL|nr:hypothetical protein GQ55_6G177900 [Panicum hallii var. hallii]
MAMENLPWWPLSAWVSPGAALFLLCNVLIGAIVVTSRGDQGGRAAASTRRLCRSASSMVLERLRSFSMFSVHPVPFEEGYDHPSMELEAEEQRQQPQPAVAEPGTPAASASAPAVAAASATSSKRATAEEVAGAGKDKPVFSEEAQGPAWQSSSPPAAVTAAAEATAAAERPETVAESIMQRARACRREVEEALEGRAALNARAELFIRQFREDLKLQRLNSIINYTRALRSGAGAPAAGQ